MSEPPSDNPWPEPMTIATPTNDRRTPASFPGVSLNLGAAGTISALNANAATITPQTLSVVVLKDDPATRDIVIVAVTAYAMAGDEDRARAAGCDGYLTKPIDKERLRQVVADILAR